MFNGVSISQSINVKKNLFYLIAYITAHQFFVWIGYHITYIFIIIKFKLDHKYSVCVNT